MNLDGKTLPIMVVGNKMNLKEDQDPQAQFASEYNCAGAGLIDTDLSGLSSVDLNHSPMRVLIYFAKKIWSKTNFNYLVPSALLAPSVGILIQQKPLLQGECSSRLCFAKAIALCLAGLKSTPDILQAPKWLSFCS